MAFWKELYQDQRKYIDMANVKQEIDLTYNIPETDGPTFEEINQILQNTNENKASPGIIKP